MSLYQGVLTSGCPYRGVSLFQGCLYRGVSLFQGVLTSGCPYRRDVLISGMSIFQGVLLIDGVSWVPFVVFQPLRCQYYASYIYVSSCYCTLFSRDLSIKTKGRPRKEKSSHNKVGWPVQCHDV